MSDTFDMNEFLSVEKEETESTPEEFIIEEAEEPEELDVQKAVVESLAADKAALGLEIESLKKDISSKIAEIEENKLKLAKTELLVKEREKSISALSGELADISKRIFEEKEDNGPSIEELQDKIKSLKDQLFSLIDSKESEQPRNPNQLALLDRDVDLPDRFAGETRDHVLEVLKEAREVAEKEGRVRRAQILESVLVANEPNGELAKRRTELEKLFESNGYVINGEVLQELKNRGISNMSGEKYLLPKEILLRVY